MARLEQALTTIVDLFMEHADGDGKLSKEEFNNLMDTEVDPDMKEQLGEDKIKKILRRTDKNRDGELNLKEFWMFVGFVMKKVYSKKGGKGEEDDDEEP